MKKVIIATVVLFCAILGVAWYYAEQAHPVMIDFDAAAPHHRPR